MNKQDIDTSYGIENYEDLFNELTEIKDDLVDPEIKLSEAISKLKRAKEINIILTNILEEAEKEVSDITDVEVSKSSNIYGENNSYIDTDNEPDFNLFESKYSNYEIPSDEIPF